MQTVKWICDWGVVLCSFLAAACWLRASLVRSPKEAGLKGALADVGPAMLLVDAAVKAMWTQSRWNAVAATFAAVAAILLGVSTNIGVLWG
jgi:hypothetical protein